MVIRSLNKEIYAPVSVRRDSANSSWRRKRAVAGTDRTRVHDFIWNHNFFLIYLFLYPLNTTTAARTAFILINALSALGEKCNEHVKAF